MKQITNEERARIFGLYLGTMVRWPEHGHFRLRGIDKYSVYIGGRYEPIPLEHFNDVQLILKPLSAISDQDAIEVAKLAASSTSVSLSYEAVDWKVDRHESRNEIWVHTNKDPLSMVHIRYDGNVYMKCNADMTRLFMDEVACVDYLRSKSYALPYLGHDLFSTGIAIPQSDVK